MECNKSIGYSLENIKLKNKRDPRHCLRPSDEEINAISVGDLVRLIFLLDRPLENGCRAERMWVSIKKIRLGSFVGILENQPRYITEIFAGDEIKFTRDKIATLLVPRGSLDEQKKAAITRRAFDNREINWAIRTDDLIDADDSGWQFLYGDEDEEYMNAPHSGLCITLEDALEAEPLLEKILCEKGETYMWDRHQNKFIEWHE